MAYFESATVAAAPHLRQGIIHSDANERNVLVDAEAAVAAAAASTTAAGAAAAPGCGTGSPAPQPRSGPSSLITGLIDWGDACWQWLAAEPAIAAVYMMLLDSNAAEGGDPLAAAAALVGGYEAELALLPQERRLLRTLAMGRLAQSLSLGARAAAAQPDNAEYLLGTQRNGWRLLRLLWGMSDDAFLAALARGDATAGGLAGV